MVDYKNLCSVEQIAHTAPAFSQGTLEKWRFHRDRMGMQGVFVEIDANVYWDVSRFNAWLYEGKPVVGDFRDLRTVQQVVARCHLPESKLRHWLKHRTTNGLDDAVIVKAIGRQGRLYIDTRLFNVWLMMVNGNDFYGEAAAASG